MDFREELTWILDKTDFSIDEETKYKLNIDFVHSLGKKCDCVGWSELDLGAVDTDKILSHIKTFCQTNGWKARGYYTRTYTGESDWYELQGSNFKEATVADRINIPADNGEELLTITIRAYHELISSPKDMWGICVPERFRNACIKNGIDTDFCWVQDKGKYDAEQYFYIYPKFLVSQIACDKNLERTDRSKIKALGGYLPKLAEDFYRLNISLPDCYFIEDMPKGGIAYAYCPSTNSFCGRYTILIHKDTVEILVNEKVLSWKDLKTVPVLRSCPDGYTVLNSKREIRPRQEYISQSLLNYEKIKKSNRPARIISEKDALKVLRSAKSDRKEDFRKRMGKNQIEKIMSTDFESLLPYFKIANGGQLSDEYEFLSYNEAVSSTYEFFNEFEKEELLENKPKGIVFAKGADGDNILLVQDGSVVRFSHETPEIIDNWKNVAQFIFDAVK